MISLKEKIAFNSSTNSPVKITSEALRNAKLVIETSNEKHRKENKFREWVYMAYYSML